MDSGGGGMKTMIGVLKMIRSILLVAILLLSLAPEMTAQDKQDDKGLLPFQKDAPKPVSDEQLGIQFYQAQDYQKAAEIFARLYNQKPSSFYYQYLYLSLVEAKEYSDAERVVRKAQRSEPDAPKFDVDLGYIQYRMGNTEKAKKMYEEALKNLEPKQQQVFDLANAFISKGENDMAIRTYLRGKELLNNAYPFGFELASVYERMGDFRNATEQYLNMLDVNRSYMNTVQDRIQMQLSNDINNEKAESLRKTLLSRAQKEPDKTWYAELLWWFSIQQKDFDLALVQAKALDRRLNENGDKPVQLASLAISNEKYDVAIECYKYLVSKGPGTPNYYMARRELVNTRYMKVVADPVPQPVLLAELEKELSEELALGPENPENVQIIRNLAHIRAFYMGKEEEAIDLLYNTIAMVGITPADKARCKIELADILLFTDDVWEATLLYQQAYQDFKFDALGQEAKFKNAKLSFYIGEFLWAKAQADVLKAATSKFISNDAIALSLLIGENFDPDSNTIALGMYARADLLDYRNKPEQALVTLDSVKAVFGYHPILPFVEYKKGLITLKSGHFAEADTLFSQVVRTYPDGVIADEALIMAARLNEFQTGNRERAMALYQELLEKYPGSIFAPEARRQFRQLRGDRIQ
jgi:tetratricopeptide (TPR) repeat protein